MTADRHPREKEREPEDRRAREMRLVLAAKSGDWQARQDLFVSLASAIWWRAVEMANKCHVLDAGLKFCQSRLMVITDKNGGGQAEQFSQADLYSAAIVHLAANLDKHLDRFDIDRGSSFWNFIYMDLKGAMVECYIKKSPVEPPYTVARLHPSVKSAMDYLSVNGVPWDEITAEQIQERLVEAGKKKPSLADIRACMGWHTSVIAGDTPISGKDGEGNRTLFAKMEAETPGLDQYERWDTLAMARYCLEVRPAFLGLDGDVGGDEITVLRTRIVWEDGEFRGARGYPEICKLLNDTKGGEAELSVTNARKMSSRCTGRLALALQIVTAQTTAEVFVAEYEQDVRHKRRPKLPRLTLTPEAVLEFRRAYDDWAGGYRGWRLDGENPLG